MQPQVIVVCPQRELAIQIADIYTEICKFSDIKVSNYVVSRKTEDCHIVVTTLGLFEANFRNRKSRIDISAVRCFVIDEAD